MFSHTLCNIKIQISLVSETELISQNKIICNTKAADISDFSITAILSKL